MSFHLNTALAVSQVLKGRVSCYQHDDLKFGYLEWS